MFEMHRLVQFSMKKRLEQQGPTVFCRAAWYAAECGQYGPAQVMSRESLKGTGSGAGRGASIHTGEHEQPGASAEGSC